MTTNLNMLTSCLTVIKDRLIKPWPDLTRYKVLGFIFSPFTYSVGVCSLEVLPASGERFSPLSASR